MRSTYIKITVFVVKSLPICVYVVEGC